MPVAFNKHQRWFKVRLSKGLVHTGSALAGGLHDTPRYIMIIAFPKSNFRAVRSGRASAMERCEAFAAASHPSLVA